MNRKKLLPLAVLAGVVVLLAAALLAVTLLNRRQDGEESGIALFSVSAGEVTALSYQDGSTDVALTQNEDGGWTLESDPLLPIDSDTVTDLLDSLTGLTALRDLSGETLESAQLGFDSPAMTFAFTAGGTDYTLTVGAENSIAGAYYVRLGGRRRLYRVHLQLFDAVQNAAAAVRRPGHHRHGVHRRGRHDAGHRQRGAVLHPRRGRQLDAG